MNKYDIDAMLKRVGLSQSRGESFQDKTDVIVRLCDALRISQDAHDRVYRELLKTQEHEAELLECVQTMSNQLQRARQELEASRTFRVGLKQFLRDSETYDLCG